MNALLEDAMIARIDRADALNTLTAHLDDEKLLILIFRAQGHGQDQIGRLVGKSGERVRQKEIAIQRMVADHYPYQPMPKYNAEPIPNDNELLAESRNKWVWEEAGL